MNTTVSYTDPGAMLGKTVLKIGQVVLALLAVASGYMAYLASEGLFSGWDIEIEEDLVWLFPRIEPEEWIFYFFIGLAVKFLIWLGVLAWLDRKI
ncbi:hypothetical protein [Algoriphagus boritolerans]|uniref:Uncharacterized protein n=1 Tax=Algoriphagus boritolerans DSM 17298 = JCM 18970 TaxID=1120964 RepID=A0A1H6AIS2_9BACT|nr:hypothetical protein [Algoriphagus boritolerans]SEG47925.1 hypothetical protein SAMN03080598_04132 [Algoriphagus boritolerans DSM 17298 = JCM 18970]